MRNAAATEGGIDGSVARSENGIARGERKDPEQHNTDAEKTRHREQQAPDEIAEH